MVSIQPYDSRYELSFAALLQRVFLMQKETAPAIVRRKFFQRPACLDPVIFVATDGENIVGQYTNAGLRLTHNEKTHEAYMCLDMCLDPAYRGQGLLKQMAISVYKKVNPLSCTLGFSNDTGVKIDQKGQNGYHIIGKFAKFFLASSRKKDPTYTFRQVTEIEPFLRSSCPNEYRSVQKDASYLNRRYIQKPNNTYIVHQILCNNVCCGYLVWKKEGRKAAILDLCLDVSVDVRRCIGAIQRFFGSYGYLGSMWYILDNTYWQYIFAHRLCVRIPTRKHYYATIKIHNSTICPPENILDIQKWLLQAGDIM